MNIEKFVVSRNDAFMEGWPDMVRLRSGRLIVSYNECDCHPRRDNTFITIRISDDNGKTWGEAFHIDERTMHGSHWNSIRLSALSDGRVILVCDKIIKPYDGEEVGAFFMFESLDGGETWSEKRDTGLRGFCSDKIREMADGSYFMTISQYDKALDKNVIKSTKSYDKGKTWKEVAVVYADGNYTFIEPCAITLEDGTVAVFIRENSHKGYNGFIAFSKDCGESFYGQREIKVAGMHRPVLGRLNDGKILLVYREKIESTYPRLKGCFWRDEDILNPDYCPEPFLLDYDNSPHPDQGYTAFTQFENDEILMVNYITDDAPKAYIRGYRINF